MKYRIPNTKTYVMNSKCRGTAWIKIDLRSSFKTPAASEGKINRQEFPHRPCSDVGSTGVPVTLQYHEGKWGGRKRYKVILKREQKSSQK